MPYSVQSLAFSVVSGGVKEAITKKAREDGGKHPQYSIWRLSGKHPENIEISSMPSKEATISNYFEAASSHQAELFCAIHGPISSRQELFLYPNVEKYN